MSPNEQDALLKLAATVFKQMKAPSQADHDVICHVYSELRLLLPMDNRQWRQALKRLEIDANSAKE